MNKFSVSIVFCLLLSTFVTSQQLPKNALDQNVVFIFNPDASVENNEETLKVFTQEIIDNGFNLVGKYLFNDSAVSLKEIELDIEKKNVKYIFLLTYRYYKGPDYDLYFYENNKEFNPDIINPNKKILQLKPGFVSTKKDPRIAIFKKLNKEIVKLKEKYSTIDTVSYDSGLINTLLLSEEDITLLKELNAKQTIIDGVTLEIKNKSIPTDLKTSKLAIIASNLDEYRSFKVLNSILKSRFKKYPFSYTYFKDYASYISNGGDNSFKYRLQLTKSGLSLLSSSKPYYTASEQYKRGSSINVSSSFNSTPINYEKDLFTVVIRNNNTNERHLVSSRNFLSNSIKEFISSL